MSITEVNLSITDIFKNLQNQIITQKQLNPLFKAVVENDSELKLEELQKLVDLFIQDYESIVKSLPLPATSHQYQLIPCVYQQQVVFPDFVLQSEKDSQYSQNEQLPIYLQEKIKLLSNQLPNILDFQNQLKQFINYIKTNQQIIKQNYQSEQVNSQIGNQLVKMNRNIDKAFIQLKAFYQDMQSEYQQK